MSQLRTRQAARLKPPGLNGLHGLQHTHTHTTTHLTPDLDLTTGDAVVAVIAGGGFTLHLQVVG
jgi:hypothetical protein